MKAIYIILLIFCTSLNATPQNQDIENKQLPIFFWDNQDHFNPADNCSIKRVQKQRFRVSTYYGRGGMRPFETLRNFNGVGQSHLRNKSLVKLIKGKSKHNYKKIEVVGVNQSKTASQNRWFSERLDTGYLFHRSVLPAEDYILKLGENSPAVEIPGVLKSLKDSMWKLASDASYYSLDCSSQADNKIRNNSENSRTYILFRVYSKDNAQGPVALVGVYWDETNIFRSFTTLTKDEALSSIPTLYEEIAIEEIDNTEPIIIEPDQDDIETPTVISRSDITINGALKDVVCIGPDTLNVRDETLDKVIFSARRGEKVKKFQGWGENQKEKVINNVLYSFIKVQFATREEEDQTIGWVARRFIAQKAKCKYLNGNVIIRDRLTEIENIDDPKCCEFPTVKKVTHSFTSGMRKFKAGRRGGKRHHAACDLYRYKNEPILSLAPGVVVRDRYYFYQGTYALEIMHSGGFIARYGEINGRAAQGIEKGTEVTMSQRIGYMGKVNSNCCRPMLHLEIYNGTLTGPLSQSGNKFQRREDLIDPTSYLLKWENDRF